MRLESKMKPRLRADSVGVIWDFKKGREKGWTFDGECQNLQTSFLIFLIFAKTRPERTIVTHTETDAETNKPIRIGEILQICQKTLASHGNVCCIS